MKLQDQVIAITGAARGLGLETAIRLGRQGAKIALIDLNKADLEHASHHCCQEGIESRIYACNVADEAQVSDTFKSLTHDFGKLNGLVNNAGIIRDGMLIKASEGRVEEKMSLATWQSVIDTNLTGVFLCGREAAVNMIETQSPGCIVNLSSVARGGNIGQTNYSAAKAGVVAMTVTWAKELARYNIRSMAVAPGFIETEMTRSMPDHAKKHLSHLIPLGVPGQAHHIADTIVHIFTNDYLTGRVIEVDGGLRV
ncbi:MAG: short chain dehydrogenase [Oleiphilus sp.]|nr:MAG: short chain dehydrogenase [Oleiphilus sp.]